jgi:hypothetical protein
MDRAADELIDCIRYDDVHWSHVPPVNGPQASQREGDTMASWVYNPHRAASRSLPQFVSELSEEFEPTPKPITTGRFSRLDIRFRGALCYIDAYIEAHPDVPLHLWRLRYVRNEEAWSMAFYTYSHEKYEPCMFGNGNFHGTPEEGFEIAAIYLKSQ